jgi:hypothetical protein
LSITHQPTATEIDHLRINGIVGRLPDRASPNEGPSPDFTADHSTPFSNGVGAAHCSYGDAEPIGQLALRGQAGSFGKNSGLDVTEERRDQGLVLGFSPGRESWRPTCHSDNVLFDSNCVNIDIGGPWTSSGRVHACSRIASEQSPDTR